MRSADTIAEPAAPPPPPDALLRALTRLLRPLVRLSIASGITFPVLATMLRGLYVEIASDERTPGEPERSDSRISLMTGIHRKELRRQRLVEPEAAAPAVVTLTSQLIGRWLGDPAYADAQGRPLPLARSGPAPSFDALVTATTRDIRPRAVLEGLLAQRIATAAPDGRIALSVTAFLPAEDREAQLYYFARNLHDHIAAASANVLAPSAPPFLDRSVHYDGLSEAAAAALALLSREAAGKLLLEVNRAALAIADGDDRAAPATGSRATRRVNLGVYLYTENEAGE